ncbi:MAG: acyl--CoA ligase [Ectothiorhodospiraceae bacterium]|nr:acyl--CoA ligase [Ectothiorhodospiraceae bacterium]
MLQERFEANSWYHRTVQDLFIETCERKPDKTAIVFNDTEISFRDLQHQVHQLSQALLQLGVGKGDVVSTLPSPTPEFTCLYFATLQVGAVVNPLNLLWGALEFQGVLPRNNPKLIVTVDTYGGRDYIQLLRTSLPDLDVRGGRVSCPSVPALAQLVCLSREGRRHDGFMDFADLAESGSDYDAGAIRDLALSSEATDIQFICQTSGTTGLSKSALWCHRPPLSTVHFAARHLCFSEDERYVNLAPFYHNSGLFALNLNLALAGTTLHLMERFEPQQAVSLIHRHRCTATFGFDAHWQGMRQAPNFSGPDFTIRKALLAGEPKSYDLVTGMCPEGAKIINLYAQTENGPGVSLGEHDCMDYRIRKFTHGRPLAGVEVVIKDIDTGERVVQGQPGEICYRSPFMFSGYLQQEEETRAAYDDEGYFHSGDYGTLDNGYITFLGRLGGVVKSGGENVSTVRVSNLLIECLGEFVDDAKTVGIPDAYWGTRVVSFLRLSAGQQMAETAALREACKGQMAAYEIPRDFLEWQGPWPMTAEGKIDFRRLQQEAIDQLAGGPAG